MIILPFAFVLSAFAAWIIVPILIMGGIYLAFEGAEKIYEYFVPHEHEQKLSRTETLTKDEILTVEKSKIKSAIVTDFILSIEIIIIALGTVVDYSISLQVIVVSFVAILATIGVYGIVAMIIRMDDVGLGLKARGEANGSSMLVSIGDSLVAALPKVIRLLTVVGTIAMLLVAGGIYVHNIPQIHDALHSIPSLIAEFFVGLVVGAVAVICMKIFDMMRG
jgi:predicted DNA repair protein MutK